MLILSIISLAVALLALLNCFRLATRLRELELVMAGRNLERPPASLNLSIPELAARPLEGKRIGIFVEQDHDRPTFSILLRDRLLQEDALPSMIEIEPSSKLDRSEDIRITGKLKCNNYSEIYFDADLSCETGAENIFTHAERPPQGARQANLASAIVNRLKKELSLSSSRDERNRALEELR